jgi:hypothetical protein
MSHRGARRVVVTVVDGGSRARRQRDVRRRELVERACLRGCEPRAQCRQQRDASEVRAARDAPEIRLEPREVARERRRREVRPAGEITAAQSADELVASDERARVVVPRQRVEPERA